MKALTLSLGIKCLRLTESLISRNQEPLLLREEIRTLSEKGPPFFISPQEIKRHFQEIVDLWKLSPRGLEVVLSSDLLFLRLTSFDLSTLHGPSLAPFLRQEAEHLIPLPLEKVTWGYQQLFFKKDTSVTVLYAAIKTEFLRTLRSALSEIKWKISTVSCRPWSFYPLLRKALSQEDVLLIDIGYYALTIVSLSSTGDVHHRSCYYSYHSHDALNKEDVFSLEHVVAIKETVTKFLSQLKISPIHLVLTGEASQQFFLFLTEDLLLSPISVTLHSTNYYNKIYLHQLYIKKASHRKSYFTRSYGLLRPPFDFSPPLLVHPEKQHQQLAYSLKLLFSLLLLLLGISFGISIYCHYATQKITQDILKKEVILDQRRVLQQQLEEKSREIKKQNYYNEELISLQQEHDTWPLLLQDLQDHLPVRYLWITNLSTIIHDVAIEGDHGHERCQQITALELKGLYLENPNNAHVVNDFVHSLQKSLYFVIPQTNLETIITYRATPDGTAYAYPFTLHLPLKKAIRLREPL